MGKPNRNRRFRAIAQAILQSVALKHSKPTSSLRKGTVTSRAHPKVPANTHRRFIMPDYSLVPVDYQPSFDDYSLVPVDHDPFAADGVVQQSQIQQAQAGPQGPLQQQPVTGAGQPDASAPVADGVLTPLTENGRVDS
jgi:hypothetical protein